jgi:hypothetical protein
MRILLNNALLSLQSVKICKHLLVFKREEDLFCFKSNEESMKSCFRFFMQHKKKIFYSKTDLISIEKCKPNWAIFQFWTLLNSKE